MYYINNIMNSAEFIKYISTPLTKEEMQLLYKANNIKYDKLNIYIHFFQSNSRSFPNMCSAVSI